MGFLVSEGNEKIPSTPDVPGKFGPRALGPERFEAASSRRTIVAKTHSKINGLKKVPTLATNNQGGIFKILTVRTALSDQLQISLEAVTNTEVGAPVHIKVCTFTAFNIGVDVGVIADVEIGS